MPKVNPHKRQVLRRIQEHFNMARLRHGTSFEQASTVDIYYHSRETSASYNYVTPRRGVAWVPGTDVNAGLNRLAELDRIPRLKLVKGLFPFAFHDQLKTIGLAVETEYPLLTYGLIPNCEQVVPNEPHEQPSAPLSKNISTYEAADENAVALWLRLGLEGRYPAPEQVDQLWQNVLIGKELYFLASYEFGIVGGAGVILNPPVAEITCLDTVAPYRRHGVASTAIRAAVHAAQMHDCSLIFLVASSTAAARLYRRLGFADLDRVVTYYKPGSRIENQTESMENDAYHVRGVAQPVSSHQ